MGIFRQLSKISRSGFEAGIGAVKSVVDVPREFAELGANIGQAASSAVDRARGIERPDKQTVLERGAQGTNFSRPTNTAQKVGFAGGQIAQLATPAGQAKGVQLGGRVAKAVGAGEKLTQFAEKLGSLSLNSLAQGAIGTVQSGDLKEGATVGATNFVAQPAFHVAGSVAGAIAKTVASAAGGYSPKVLEKAFRDPEAVRKAINFSLEQGDEAMVKIRDKAVSALDELKQARQTAYQANLAKVKDSGVKDLSLDGVKENLHKVFGDYGIEVSDAIKLPGAKQAAKKVVKTSGAKIHEEDLAVMSDFTDYIAGDLKLKGQAAKTLEEDARRIAEHYKIEVPKTKRALANKFGQELEVNNWQPYINKAQQKSAVENVTKAKVDIFSSKFPRSFKKNVQELYDTVLNWKKMTPEGIDTLLTKLDNLKAQGDAVGSETYNGMVSKIKESVQKYVDDTVPEVAKLRSDYSKPSELIDRVKEELLNGKDSTNIRKLANIFSPNNNVYRKIISELGEKTGRDFLADISGTVLSKATPEGLGKYMSVLGGYTGLTSGAAMIGAPQLMATVPAAAIAASPRLSGEAAMLAGRLAPAAGTAVKAAAGLAGKTIDALTPDRQPEQVPQPAQQNIEQLYPQYRSQIQQARDAGISDEEIMMYLQQKLGQ